MRKLTVSSMKSPRRALYTNAKVFAGDETNSPIGHRRYRSNGFNNATEELALARRVPSRGTHTLRD